MLLACSRLGRVSLGHVGSVDPPVLGMGPVRIPPGFLLLHPNTFFKANKLYSVYVYIDLLSFLGSPDDILVLFSGCDQIASGGPLFFWCNVATWISTLTRQAAFFFFNRLKDHTAIDILTTVTLPTVSRVA